MSRSFSVHDLFPPILDGGEPHRGPLARGELRRHGFRSPGWYLWRRQRVRVVVTVLVVGALAALLARGYPATLLLICAALYLFGLSFTVGGSLVGSTMLRPDIFVGWSFGTALETRGISPRLARLTAYLWPTWGPVALVPPPADPLSEGREEAGFRGAEYPFVLRASGDWEAGVEWLLSQCRLAVFDVSEGVGLGLQTEIDLARAHLRADEILLVESDGDGGLQITVGGDPLEVPVEALSRLDEIELSGADRALCCVRAWLAANVPVPRRTFARRERWAKVDRAMAIWSSRLLIGALLVGALHFASRCFGGS